MFTYSNFQIIFLLLELFNMLQQQQTTLVDKFAFNFMDAFKFLCQQWGGVRSKEREEIIIFQIRGTQYLNKHFISIMYQTEKLCSSQNFAVFDVTSAVKKNHTKYGKIDARSCVALTASCHSYSVVHAVNFITISHRGPVASLGHLSLWKQPECSEPHGKPSQCQREQL